MDESGGSPSESQATRRVRFLGDRRIVFDNEGFFLNPDDWSKEVARLLAAESGLNQMGPDHWRVLTFFREFYYQNGRAPLNKQLRNSLGMDLLTLEGMFPEGIKMGARRLAGLPNPKSCL